MWFPGLLFVANLRLVNELSLIHILMQGNTKNPMADSGIMGISAGSVFAIVLMMAFLPDASRLERIGYSCLRCV